MYNQRSASGTYQNIIDANATISCNDSAGTDRRASPRCWRGRRRLPSDSRSSAAPVVGGASCLGWQPDRTPSHRRPRRHPKRAGDRQPARPGHAVRGRGGPRRRNGQRRLLSWDGEGHTSYLNGSTCIDSYVNNYLITRRCRRRTRCAPRNDRSTQAARRGRRRARCARSRSCCTAAAPGADSRPRNQSGRAADAPVRVVAAPVRPARGWSWRRCATGCAAGTVPTRSPVADTLWALDQLTERFPDVPVALVGHSMGGRAAMYCRRARRRAGRSSGSLRGSSRATRSVRSPGGAC